MPECPEVTILSHYLKDELIGKTMKSLEVISGKYLNSKITGASMLDGQTLYKIINVDSKGKVLYITLKHLNDVIYFVSHLGMAGEWSFEESDMDRVRLHLNDDKTLSYVDPRNFGNIEVLLPNEFTKRIGKLAPDVLKIDFTDYDFYEIFQKYLKKSKKRYNQCVFKVLTKQNLSDGIFSGLGNYLIPEILYDAKISPYRTMQSLTKEDILVLGHSIKYITKLSYYNNTTGYMTNFGNYSKIHKDGIDSKIYPNYHTDIKIKKTETFKFKVYRKNTDPFGNQVIKDKELNKGRTVYWVKEVQI